MSEADGYEYRVVATGAGTFGPVRGIAVIGAPGSREHAQMLVESARRAGIDVRVERRLESDWQLVHDANASLAERAGADSLPARFR